MYASTTPRTVKIWRRLTDHRDDCAASGRTRRSCPPKDVNVSADRKVGDLIVQGRGVCFVTVSVDSGDARAWMVSRRKDRSCRRPQSPRSSRGNLRDCRALSTPQSRWQRKPFVRQRPARQFQRGTIANNESSAAGDTAAPNVEAAVRPHINRMVLLRANVLRRGIEDAVTRSVIVPEFAMLAAADNSSNLRRSSTAGLVVESCRRRDRADRA